MRIRDFFLSVSLASGLLISPEAEAGATPVLKPAQRNAPQLDGIWTREEWTGGDPAMLSAPGRSEKAEVYVVETSSGLYIGIHAKDKSPVFGRSPKGESLHREDVFEIFFEMQGDDRRYAEFQISRSGAVFYKSYKLVAKPEVTSTGRLTPEFLQRSFKESIDPLPHGMQSASSTTGDAWVAEVFLPRRLLGTDVRANFALHDWDRAFGQARRKGRFYYWSAIESGCPHISSARFGIVDLRS